MAPLHRDLDLAEGMRVGLDDPPPEFVGLTLLPVPDGVTLHSRIAGNMDLVIGFYERRRDFEARLPVLRRRIPDDGAIWVCWPTAGSQVRTDLDADTICAAARTSGLVQAKTASIDHAWTALKLVVDAG